MRELLQRLHEIFSVFNEVITFGGARSADIKCQNNNNATATTHLYSCKHDGNAELRA